MKIIVEGHEIETREIIDIREAGWRKHGFIIRLIGPKEIEITETEEYDISSSQAAGINDRYRALREKIKEKWNEDKTEIPILNL